MEKQQKYKEIKKIVGKIRKKGETATTEANLSNNNPTITFPPSKRCPYEMQSLCVLGDTQQRDFQSTHEVEFWYLGDERYGCKNRAN